MKLKIVITLLSMFLLSGIVNAAPVQWDSGSGGNDHWYDIKYKDLTWTDAKVDAEGLGGYLATLTTASENTFVIDTFFPTVSIYGPVVWIGGIRLVDSTWTWITGEAWGQDNWKQPNFPVADPVDRDYLQLSATTFDRGQWQNQRNQLGQAYIIEYETSSVPIPGAIFLLGSGLLCFVGIHRKKK